jgi:capsular exopolysaccharide synthesis family protein
MAQHIDWRDVETPEQAPAEEGVDLAGMLWRRKWILVCVTIITVALGYLYYLQATPVYRSYTQVLLVKREANLSGSQEGRRAYGYGYEDTMSTHALLIGSPLIISKAVETYHLASLSSLKDEESPVGTIIQGLRVTRAGDRNTPDPNVMDMRYEGFNQRECAAILDAILKTYQEFLGETYRDFSEETWQLISQAKDVLAKQLSEKETAYRQFRQESPLLWVGREAANLHEARMAQIEKSRSEVLVQNAELKGRIEALENALKQGGNREALSLLAKETKSQEDPTKSQGSRDSLEEKLFLALVEEQDLLGEYGADHPKVRAAQKKAMMLRERLGSLPLAESGNTSDFILVYIESLRQELKVGEERYQELDNRFEQERQEAKKLANFQMQDDQQKAEIERLKKIFDTVVKRLEEINLIKDYSGGISAKILCPPSAGYRVRPLLAVIAAISCFAGLLCGFGLAYLIDMADKSFRSPEEIRRQLGLPVIGHIPVIDNPGKKDRERIERSGISPVLCTFHQPKSRVAEAYRAVRTSLYFSTQGEGHKVIQVTSPNPGDGKTTLAANLAVSMADSGKRVLLVEADFRRPRVHAHFGLDNTVGVSSVIAGDTEIADAIHQTPIKNLWAMPCGPRPHNPSDLLTSPQFKEMIDSVREQHDFVIIDTPPVLAVTDASVVAPRVDAVLLVVRLTKHTREAATRATEMLGALGARILGVIVNGIGKSSNYGYGSYRYGGYRYGGGRYGYRYTGYSYGYGSSGGSTGMYYSDEETDRVPKRRGIPKEETRTGPEA